jgi:hypothetical protein
MIGWAGTCIVRCQGMVGATVARDRRGVYLDSCSTKYQTVAGEKLVQESSYFSKQGYCRIVPAKYTPNWKDGALASL